MHVTVTKKDGGIVEISGELETSLLMEEWPRALADFNESLTIEGFRKGHAPEHIIVAKVGEEAILREAAERALGTAYPSIIKEHNIDAIGRPSVRITKLAKNNPLGFVIETAVAPEVTLGDYKAHLKALPAQEPAEEVAEKDVDTVLEELRRARAKEEVLPELNDEFATTVGDFTTLNDLRTKVRENLSLEKAARAKDKRRIALLDALIAKIPIEIPDLLIESEIDKMLAELKDSTSRMNISFVDYLTHIKKTEGELRHAWRDDARKRVAGALILEAIGKKEKLKPDPEKLAHEVAHMKEHYPDAPSSRIEHYVHAHMVNDLVFSLLEKSTQ